MHIPVFTTICRYGRGWINEVGGHQVGPAHPDRSTAVLAGRALAEEIGAPHRVQDALKPAA